MEKINSDKKKSPSNIITPVKISLFGVGITNDAEENILEYIVTVLNNSRKNCYIVTPNPEIIVFSQKKEEFKNILNEAEIALCDGSGLWWASNVLGKPIQQRIPGVDFMEKLCQKVSNQPITVGFLGGRHGVAELTSECLKQKYPNLKVVFTRSSPNILISQYPHIDVLFVAYGFPKQEEWMHEHLNKIPVRVMMGVGGAFDYISGKVPRAPKMLRIFGLEWFYRLLRQPWRWRRQIALLEFIWLVLKERVKTLLT